MYSTYSLLLYHMFVVSKTLKHSIILWSGSVLDGSERWWHRVRKWEGEISGLARAPALWWDARLLFWSSTCPCLLAGHQKKINLHQDWCNFSCSHLQCHRKQQISWSKEGGSRGCSQVSFWGLFMLNSCSFTLSGGFKGWDGVCCSWSCGCTDMCVLKAGYLQRGTLGLVCSLDEKTRGRRNEMAVWVSSHFADLLPMDLCQRTRWNGPGWGKGSQRSFGAAGRDGECAGRSTLCGWASWQSQTEEE